jgi:hypothetical protein
MIAHLISRLCGVVNHVKSFRIFREGMGRSITFAIFSLDFYLNTANTLKARTHLRGDAHSCDRHADSDRTLCALAPVK